MNKNVQYLFPNINSSQEQFIQKDTSIQFRTNGDIIGTKTSSGHQNSNHKIDPFEQINSLLNIHPKKELDSNISFKDFTQNNNYINSDIEKQGTNFETASKRKRKSSSLLLFRNNTLTFLQSLKSIVTNDDTIYGKNTKFKEFLHILLALFSLISVIFSILDNELYIKNTRTYLKNNFNISLTDLTNEEFKVLEYSSHYLEKRKISTTENIFRYISLISSNICCFILFRKYKIQIYLYKLDKKFSEYDGLFSTGNWKKLTVECIICLICIPPYINKIVCISQLSIRYIYTLNSLILPFTFFKLYNIGRMYFLLSKFNSKISKTICQTHKISSGFFFTIKSEITLSPIKIGIACFFVVILIFSFLVRDLENLGYDKKKGLEGNKGLNDLQNLMNNIWMLIVIITGVSYGDKYPRTNLGRIIVYIVCLIGMLLIGFSIAIISETIYFNENEEKAFSKLKKIFSTENIEHKAGNVIKDLLLMRRNIKKSKNDLTKLYNKHELFCEKIIICMKIKSDSINFKNKLHVSRSYSMPINDAIFHMEHKLYENLILFSNHLDKVSVIESDFNILKKQQNSITRSIKKINYLQDKISKFLIEKHNFNYLNEGKIKKERKKKLINSNSIINIQYCKKNTLPIKYKKKTFKSVKFPSEIKPKSKNKTEIIRKENKIFYNQNRYLSPPKTSIKPARLATLFFKK